MKKNSEKECGPREGSAVHEREGKWSDEHKGKRSDEHDKRSPEHEREGKRSPEQRSDEHGECCDECRRTCKRNFWTEVLRTLVKVGTAVMAAFGLSSWVSETGE